MATKLDAWKKGEVLLFQFYIQPIPSPSLPWGTNLDFSKVASMQYGRGEIEGLYQKYKKLTMEKQIVLIYFNFIPF